MIYSIHDHADFKINELILLVPGVALGGLPVIREKIPRYKSVSLYTGKRYIIPEMIYIIHTFRDCEGCLVKGEK